MKDFKREIETTNILKLMAKKALEVVLPQLMLFKGKKVFLADGSRAKNFLIDFSAIAVEKLAEASNSSIQNCYISQKYGKLYLAFKLSFNGGSYDVKPATGWTKYVGNEYELGTCKDGQIIEELFNIDDIEKTYNLNEVLNVEEELAKVKKFKELEKQAEEAQRAIKVGHEFYKYL